MGLLDLGLGLIYGMIRFYGMIRVRGHAGSRLNPGPQLIKDQNIGVGSLRPLGLDDRKTQKKEKDCEQE